MKRNIFHNISKKAVAFLAATVMVTAGTTTAWAESSYQNAEQTVLDSFVASITERWNAQMEEVENHSQATNLIVNFKLEDTTKYLLNFLTSMDFSWLNNIALSVNTAVNQKSEEIDMNLQLNGSQILQFLEQVNISNAEIYMKVPELFDGSIKVPMEVTGNVTMPDGTTQEMSPQEAQQFLTSMSDVTTFLPDTATTAELLNRYKDIVLAEIEDGAEAKEQELV